MAEFLIAIPSYNGFRRVELQLQNLQQRTPKDIDYGIVVCDDSGKIDHRWQLRRVCERAGVRYIENPSNLGVPASWNALVRSDPGSKYIILLNDDVFVDKDWLRPFAFALRNNPAVGSFSLNCLFITADDAYALASGPDAKPMPLNVRYENGKLIRNERFHSFPTPNDGPPGRVMCPGGMAFGFRREIYNMVGGFDERYFAFKEETDFGCSMARRGYPTFTLSNPPNNYHIWSATFASAPERNWTDVMNDSRRKFVAKWSQILGIQFSDAPDIHNLLMDKIPPVQVRWLALDGQERTALL